MAENKGHRISGDLSELILLVLLKEGALTMPQLQEHTAWQRLDSLDHYKWESREKLKVAATCDDMVNKKLIQITKDAKYELTEIGRVQAESTAREMERGAALIENQFLSPAATARNATAIYIFMSAL